MALRDPFDILGVSTQRPLAEVQATYLAKREALDHALSRLEASGSSADKLSVVRHDIAEADAAWRRIRDIRRGDASPPVAPTSAPPAPPQPSAARSQKKLHRASPTAPSASSTPNALPAREHVAPHPRPRAHQGWTILAGVIIIGLSFAGGMTFFQTQAVLAQMQEEEAEAGELAHAIGRIRDALQLRKHSTSAAVMTKEIALQQSVAALRTALQDESIERSHQLTKNFDQVQSTIAALRERLAVLPRKIQPASDTATRPLRSSTAPPVVATLPAALQPPFPPPTTPAVSGWSEATLRAAAALKVRFKRNNAPGVVTLVSLRSVAGKTLAVSLRLRKGFSLAPLIDSPISELEIQGDGAKPIELTNLTPLVKLPLKSLSLSQVIVRDLAPLAKCENLEVVDLMHATIISIAALQDLPIRVLRLPTTLKNWRALAEMTDLKVLELTGVPISDYKMLTGSKLTEAWLGNNRARDLRPLKDMPLKTLVISGTRVNDLTPLMDTISLRVLRADRTAISDLAPLKDIPLTHLSLAETPVRNLAPLAMMTTLIDIDLTDTKIKDLTPLANLPLQRLAIPLNRKLKGVEVLLDINTLTEIIVGKQRVEREALRKLFRLRENDGDK